jgi:hypothetical protein
MLETPEFDLKCRNVEFFQWLKSEPNHSPIRYNNDLNINESKQVEKLMNGFKLGLIEDCYEYGDGSNVLRYNFEDNLRLCKHEKSAFEGLSGKREVPDEQIMATFNELDLKKPSNNSIYEFGMKRITPETIRQYKRIKQEHMKQAMYFDRPDENLKQMYE